jgi:hypothetical protein
VHLTCEQRGLQRLVNLLHAQFQEAWSNAKTVWPDGFDVKAIGVQLLEG